MKKVLILASALTGALLTVPAFAQIVEPAPAKVIQGCEVVDMGGYFNKADPTCQFTHQVSAGGSAGLVVLPPGATLEDIKNAIEDTLNG